MEEKLISYDVISQSIKELTKDQLKELWENSLKELENSIMNYADYKLSEQETLLFKFPESSFLSNDQNLLNKTVLNLVGEVKKSKNYLSYIAKQTIDFKSSEKNELLLNYRQICAITNIIIYIVENYHKKKEIIFKFYHDNKLPTKLDFTINNMKYSSFINIAKEIKLIKFCLSNKNYNNNYEEKKEQNNIDIYVIQLFCLFFHKFFDNTLIISIDLNIYEINNYFNLEINPYKIKEKEILKQGNNYKNIILGNLIIMKILSQLTFSKLNCIMYDSYQIELHQLMTNYFAKDTFDVIDKKDDIITINTDKFNYSPLFQNNFLFFQHIFQKKNMEIFKFKIQFNSLDPLLFSYVNLVLVRYALAKISLSFFNFDQINIRKILINSYYYNFYSDEKKNPLLPKYFPNKIKTKWDNNYKIYYEHIINLNDNENKEFLLFKEEMILNELFSYFNYNLNALLVILDNKIKEGDNMINSIKLNFTSYGAGNINLNSYNNYNSSIICFIFNLFYILEENKLKSKLTKINIQLDNFCEEKEFIIRNIQNKIPYYKKKKVFNLNELKLESFSLNISNISLFLPFHNFPIENLTTLVIDNLTYTDLNNLIFSLTNHENLFKKLSNLTIGFNYLLEDFRKELFILLKNYIPKNLRKFILKIPSYISNDDIINLITLIKRNKNTKSTLKISNGDLSPYIGDKRFLEEVKKFEIYLIKELNKRNVIGTIKKIHNNRFSLGFKVLNAKDINYYLKFIYCFNKLYTKSGQKINNKDKNKKIFENIFDYMGKYKEVDKQKIKIEII